MKHLILKTTVLLVVFMFIGTAFLVVIDHCDNPITAGIKPDSIAIPSSKNYYASSSEASYPTVSTSGYNFTYNLTLLPGAQEYFFSGSTPARNITSTSWEPEFQASVNPNNMGFQGTVISMGNQSGNYGNYTSSAANYQISGFGIVNFSKYVMYSNYLRSFNSTQSLNLSFNVTSNALAVIMVAGGGVGSINLSDPLFSALYDFTYSEAGNDVNASGAAFSAKLSGGSYKVNINSTMNSGTNSGTGGILAAIAYIFYPTSQPSSKNYKVTFNESGLPIGTSWSATLNGTTKSSTTDTMTFSVPNGTYSYTIGSVSGYTVSPSSGSINVSGENVKKAITFSTSKIYSMSFWVLYKNLPYTINLTINSSALKRSLSVNVLPEKLSLYNVSTYLFDFETDPDHYNIYSMEILTQDNSPVTNVTTSESIMYQTLVWAMLYNNVQLLQNTYGTQSNSFTDLTALQQTQWVPEAGVYLSDFVNYATLVGPILGGISSYFSSNSKEVKLADMATHAIFDIMKGYKSLEDNYGQQNANSILNTLAQYGVISSTDPSAYDPSTIITNLAQLNPDDINSLVLSMYSDLGVQSDQVNAGVGNLVDKILENLGENALSVGFSAASSSAVTFLQDYFVDHYALETASDYATQAALGSLEDSASDFLAFMLPLSIANAIYSGYLEPMSSDLEQVVNAQNLMNDTIYPALIGTLGSYSDGNYANVSDAAASMFLIGMVNSEWYNWFNASIAELKGEFLNFNANQEIQDANPIQYDLFIHVKDIYFALHNASLMADSLINGQQPTVEVSPSIIFSEIIPTLPITINQVESGLSQGWQQFTGEMSSAAEYVSNPWSNLTSGIDSMSASFSNFAFGSDPPEFTLTMDNFTAVQALGALRSTYPMSSIMYGNNSVTLILPGNTSGYLSTEVNESVQINAVYYNASSPQTPVTLALLNAESGNAYIMYIKSSSFGKKAVMKGYSLSFTESDYGNIAWEVEVSSYNGTIKSSIISNDRIITFNNLPNGSYYFSLASLNTTYKASPMNGTMAINGYNQSKQIIFSQIKYNITFTESGLPSGTSWSVTFNGTTESSTTDTMTFSVPNGTYSYSIGSVSGYTVSPSTGSITVNGKNVSQSITFTSSSTTTKASPSGISSTDIYAIMGAVLAVAVIGSAIAVMRKRK